MKIIRINGGLGNQMFQYAFGLKLQYLHPDENVLFDLKDFRGYNRSYELEYVFGLKLPQPSFFQLCRLTFPFSENAFPGNHLYRFRKKYKTEVYDEQEFRYCEEILNLPGDHYYMGYWANEGYFSDIRDKILDAFTFRRPLCQKSNEYLEQIKHSNSVSIHVRRGDYLRIKLFQGICELDYYEKAINYIKNNVENPHFFIFSNDIQWCKENILNCTDGHYTTVELNDPLNNYVDMQLMSCCKHNIIAHSTFSWWAAWLNRHPEKIVVAPYRWVNRSTPYKPQLKDWILID